MTVAELLEKEKDNFDTFEVWKYSDKTRRLHTDFIENIDGNYSTGIYKDVDVKDYYIMDEAEYNRTVCANCMNADFDECYDDADAKVLVIMLDYNANLENDI